MKAGRKKGYKHSKETLKKIKIRTKEAMDNLPEEKKEKIRKSARERTPWNKGNKEVFKGENNPFFGKKHSKISKENLMVVFTMNKLKKYHKRFLK